MLVCVKPLIATDGGVEVRLVPEISRVAKDHPLARAHPHHFRPATDRPAGARERVYSSGGSATMRRVKRPTAPLALERWRLPERGRVCRAGAGRSPTFVRFTDDARAVLLGEFERSDVELEHGALLYGVTHPTLIEVLAVAPAGPGAIGRRASFKFDAAHWNEQDRAMATRGLVRVGDAHSHPACGGSPSAADLNAWHARAGDAPVYLGLLAVRLRNGWDFVPWVVAGRRCERAWTF